MKKSNVLLVLGCSIFLYIGCTPEEDIRTPLEETSKDAIFYKEEKALGDCETKPIENQLVIKYGINSLDKKREIRKKYKIKGFKTCSCADETLELWYFGTDKLGNPIDIEEKKQSASVDPDLEGVNNNFMLNTTGTDGYYSSGTPLSNVFATHLITGVPNGVGIAILDTGLQFDYLGFNTPFLYNSLSNGSACNDEGEMEISGWDFINQDHVPNDNNGHGTIVTKIISQTLEDLDIDYRILPIKIFNKKGKGSYFDLLCGYQFAVNKPDIDIINMSFGWCGKPQSLLHKFIQETEKEGKILIVTSAGNKVANNDVTAHYPSSYTNTNVLSIAAMNSKLTGLASFSNYGKQSVDFAATGENIVFNFNEGSQKISGTSFSTAFASANAAWFYSKGIIMKEIRTSIKATSIKLSSLETIKYASYILD